LVRHREVLFTVPVEIPDRHGDRIRPHRHVSRATEESLTASGIGYGKSKSGRGAAPAVEGRYGHRVSTRLHRGGCRHHAGAGTHRQQAREVGVRPYCHSRSPGGGSTRGHGGVLTRGDGGGGIGAQHRRGRARHSKVIHRLVTVVIVDGTGRYRRKGNHISVCIYI